MFVVCEPAPSVTVTVALWLKAIVAAAVALNVAVVVPAATSTEAGTVREGLLLDSITVEPPEGAVCVRVTAQLLTALGPRLVGLQITPETNPGARRLMVVVCELPLSIAVTIAL